MEEDEIIDSEQVLEKYTVKLNDKSEELECIITKSHLVIEAEEVIRLPFSHIVNRDVQYLLPSITYLSQPLKQHSGTVTLTYLDELNKKQKLSLEMPIGSLYQFKESINEQIAKNIKPMKGKYTEQTERSPWGWVTLCIVALFGTWIAAGIIAGINWRIMGRPKLMWPTIIVCIIASIVHLYLITSSVHPGRMIDEWIFFFAALGVATGLWLWQRNTRRAWQKSHPTAPRAGWRIPLLTVIAVDISIIIVGFAVFIIAWSMPYH